MKTKILKLLLCISVSTFSFNAFAQWQCYVNDKGGHTWRSEGSTKDRATAVAMSFCSSSSPDSKSCQFNQCMVN